VGVAAPSPLIVLKRRAARFYIAIVSVGVLIDWPPKVVWPILFRVPDHKTGFVEAKPISASGLHCILIADSLNDS
jgi:hypothetical protein